MIWVGDWEVEDGDRALHRAKLRKRGIGMWMGKGGMLEYLMVNKHLVFEIFHADCILKSISMLHASLIKKHIISLILISL